MRSTTARLLFDWTMVLVLGSALFAQAAESPAGGVSPLVAQEADWLVFRADQELDELFELYALRMRSGESPIKLTQPLDGSVASYGVTPDARRVAYVAGGHCYSTRIDGSEPPIRLSMGPDVVQSFEISPRGGFVIYLTGTTFQRAPIDGSQAAFALNPPSGETPIQYEITPDGQSMVYITDSWEVFSLNTSTLNTPILMSGFVPNNYEVYDFEIASDSSLVILLNRHLVGFHQQYYIYNLHYSHVHLPFMFPLVLDKDSPPKFDISPNGSRLVYQDRPMLFSASFADTSPTILLNDPMDDPRSPIITPDGRSVIYSARLPGWRLRATPIDSSDPVAITLPFSRGPKSTSISPDSSRALFISSWPDFNGPDNVFSVPLDASSQQVQLNSPLPPNGDIISYRVTPDSTQVLVHGRRNGMNELRRIPIDGSQPSSPITVLLPGELLAFELTSDGSDVVFIGDPLTSGVVQLFTVPLDGSTPPMLQTPSIVTGGNVITFELASSRKHVDRRATPSQSTTVEIP